MTADPSADFSAGMRTLNPSKDSYVPEIVTLLLMQARQHRASDVHLVPTESGLQMQWRIDGLLKTVAIFDGQVGPRIIARLKVISGLLTYRTDLPQEGRVSREYSAAEVRVTTFPTLHGEKAAIRLFAESQALQRLEQLGLPHEIHAALVDGLSATDGVILLTGPSGSGKTTTAYACLREIQRVWGESRSVMTLEDPIEVAVTGVTQSQVRTQVGFDLASGLKSLMRQDPDVILVGEIRDPATAEVVFQAALTGHLVLTTFHAGSAIEAITRLLDLQIEPYLLRSTLRSVICQRLVRRIQTDHAGRTGQAEHAVLHAQGDHAEYMKSGQGIAPGQILKTSLDSSDKLSGLSDPPAVLRDVQAEVIRRTAEHGYNGRIVLAELLNPDVPEIAKAILQRADSRQLTTVAKSCGYRTLFDSGDDAVRAGLTTEDEVFRVLGKPR